VGSRASEDDWNQAICAWFFNESARGRPVYLCLDEPELGRIALASGFDDQDAPAAFKAAMAACCRLPKDPFSYWRLATQRWERASSPPRPRPPFISLLGLTTLVANDATQPGASRAFYDRLARVLGADLDSVKRDYEETVRTWWAKLRSWLSEHEERFGLATAAAQDTGFRSIIGHAWSQVVVRAPDRADFTEFFGSLGIVSGEELDLDPEAAPNELFVRWKAWVRRGGPVSERLRTVIDDSRGPAGELGALVARILADELAHWDGTARDAERRAVLPLVVTANTFDRHELAFSALVPPELAGRALVIGGETVHLGDAADLTEVPIPVTADNLTNGVRLYAGSTLVRYAGRPIVPLALRQSDVWRSVDQLEPGEDAYALVADWATDSFLRAVPEPRRSAAVDNVPAGWVLYRDVELDAGSATVAGDAVALVPRMSELPHLRGGLRLGLARHYLAEGAPDVVVPAAEGLETKVAVDREVIACFGPEGGIVRLADYGLLAGEHVVVAGARRFRVALEPFDWWEPPPVPGLAHVFPSDGLLAAAVRSPTATDNVVAAGPVVSGVDPPPLPLLMPAPEAAVLLGAPGESQPVRAAIPPWASRVGLQLGAFEPLGRLATEPSRSFVPVWVAYRSAGVWRVRLVSTMRASRRNDVAEQLDWAREVVSLREAIPEGDAAEAEWSRYVGLADGVVAHA
jgi:hypothetical protein